MVCRALGCSQVGELRASKPGGVSEPRAPCVCIRIVLPCRLFGQIIVIELCPVITSIKNFFNPNKESPPAQSTLPRQVPWSLVYMVGLPFHFSPHGSQNQIAQFRESVSLLSETRSLESDLKFRLRSTVPGSGSKDSPTVFCLESSSGPAAEGVWMARGPGPSIKVGEGSASKDESVWPLLGLTGTLPGSGAWSGTPSRALGTSCVPGGSTGPGVL